MQIFVNGLDGAVVKLDANYETSVGEIKDFIEAKDAILSFGSKILDIDSATLGALEIPDEATFNVNVRLLGGKVHGSLARAGKVRAQTPKVEKQEKKKKKRGKLSVHFILTDDPPFRTCLPSSPIHSQIRQRRCSRTWPQAWTQL